jgi:hypothetical protein
MWAKAQAVGNAPALSTGCAGGAVRRIVHMYTALPLGALAGSVWRGRTGGSEGL